MKNAKNIRTTLCHADEFLSTEGTEEFCQGFNDGGQILDGLVQSVKVDGVDFFQGFHQTVLIGGYQCVHIGDQGIHVGQQGLHLLAPDKTREAILRPMGLIRDRVLENRQELVKYKHAPSFAPAGQSTQLIVGATQDTDRHILHLTEALYQKYRLKRVFYSAYVPVVENSLLPSLDTKPPLLREHRLYQADWLLRFYGFRASELLDEAHPDFNPRLDPKCSWAVAHLEQFPVEIMRAEYETLLRVPGIGPTSAKRILAARRTTHLRFEELKKLGVVVKRAQYFVLCDGHAAPGLRFSPSTIVQQLEAAERGSLPEGEMQQLSLFDAAG